jgi:hypothetical protein
VTGLRCNGCAWGWECPRAKHCALKAAGDAVPERERPRDWNIHDSRAGWSLLHCQGAHLGEFEFFEPRPSAVMPAQAELFA